MRIYRVIQYGAGNTGKFALRSILTHPQLDLVGLGVHGISKEGKDAGTICRLEPTGILATRDVQALMALPADCVCFMPSDPHAGDVADVGSHAGRLLDLLCEFLASGKNVIATAPNALVYAPSLGSAVTARLEAACRKGRTSFYYAGVSPGFVPDRLVLNLTAVSTRIDSISVQEIMNYGAYDDREMLFGFYGFGSRPTAFDQRPLLAAFGRSLGGSVATVAAGLALDLEDIRTEIDFATTDKPFDVPTGNIAIGTIGAERIRSAGMVDGKPRIVVEHITRVGEHVAPHWPTFGPGGAEGYRIAIAGAPSMNIDIEFGAFGRNPMADAGWAVGGHIGNAIALVCEAPSGIRSVLDLPPVMAKYRMSH